MLLLNNSDIEKKITRICWEIYEQNISSNELYVFGIEKKGYLLAQKMKHQLSVIFPGKVHLFALNVNNISENTSFSANDVNNKPFILVDDVLNTGKSLIHGVKKLLDYSPQKITTVVLIDREHRLFPVKADIVGLTLSTSMSNHIEVTFSENGELNAFLS